MEIPRRAGYYLDAVDGAGMSEAGRVGGPVAALTAKKATGGPVTRPALVKVERSLASNTLTPPQAEQGEYVRSPPADSAP